MDTKIKLPTWKESYAREQNGGASALEKFISTWEPAGESTEAAFRAMLERTLNDTTDELRAENGRLRAELDEARELMAEIEFRIVSEGYSFEDVQETAGHIDRMLVRTGYRT